MQGIRYTNNMKKKALTHKEISSRGGKTKWSKIKSKKQRSEIMRAVVMARWAKK